jgi:glutathione S-transferase
VRLVLAECDVSLELVEERTWERREEFLLLNPAGTLPVLIDNEGPPICGAWPASEYLDETRGFALADRRLMPSHADQRAEVRRLMEWFLFKLDEEVTSYLVEEKVVKRERAKSGGNGGAPNSSLLRAARANIRTHLHYLEHLIEKTNWLAGDRMSYADLAAAAALSVADYLGEAPWQDFARGEGLVHAAEVAPGVSPAAGRTGARPSPAAHYAELDF